MSCSLPPASQKNAASGLQLWYHPIFSPDHGVYVMLIVSFLTGAAAAQTWTILTTVALVCSFAAFQAEYPLVLQIKQRRSWKPRFMFWGVIYAGIAFSLTLYLYLQTPLLLWLYLGAIAVLGVDVIAVFYRQQKSVANELLTFTAVCLAAPFAYIATTGTWTMTVLGLWLLNSLFFSSAIFTVKLRKPKTASLVPALVYHLLASVVMGGLWYIGWLQGLIAITLAIVLLKFVLIIGLRQWYQNTTIQNVAIVETFAALIFLMIVVISLLR